MGKSLTVTAPILKSATVEKGKDHANMELFSLIN